MTIGARIKAEREAQGMSRPELAKASGVPYPTLAGLENSDQAGSTQLPAIAAALGVNARWLQTGKGPKLSVHEAPSQYSGFDFGKLQDAITLTQHFLEVSTGSKDGWDDPALLRFAYEIVAEDARSLSDAVLIDFSKRLAAKIRTREKTDGDQRREAAGTGGKDGGGGKRRAGKA